MVVLLSQAIFAALVKCPEIIALVVMPNVRNVSITSEGS